MTSVNWNDLLASGWDEAEQGIAKAGDLVIGRNDDGTFDVHTITVDQSRHEDDLRILTRAPKPKPAWHNAVAITATWYDHVEDETLTGVWTPDSGVWMHEQGVCVDAASLTDVTPLIEARITDYHARKALDSYYEYAPGEHDWPDDTVGLMRSAIMSALGIEADQ